MGYCTLYSLMVRGDNLTQQTVKQLNAWFEEHNILHYAFYDGALLDSFPEICFDHEGNSVHWYEHEEDMMACSKAFPELTFCLHGEGDDQFDYWNKYFHNGECEVCHVIWELPKPTRIQWKEGGHWDVL